MTCTIHKRPTYQSSGAPARAGVPHVALPPARGARGGHMSHDAKLFCSSDNMSLAEWIALTASCRVAWCKGSRLRCCGHLASY